jgi:hypothetical protein
MRTLVSFVIRCVAWYSRYDHLLIGSEDEVDGPSRLADEPGLAKLDGPSGSAMSHVENDSAKVSAIRAAPAGSGWN